ncbi:MAG: 50S ribosomal protein L9 [Pseudomonadota bacterium]
MDVILLQKVQNLGNLGDKVKVKAGFGRNFLIPQGKAVPATAANVAEFDARRAALEKAAAEALAEAQKRGEALNGMAVTISMRAGDDGKLFGSVGTTDIAEAVSNKGVKINKSEVRLPAGPIRMVGEYEVGVHLHVDVDSVVKVSVIPA